jgi:hypothetical protein
VFCKQDLIVNLYNIFDYTFVLLPGGTRYTSKICARGIPFQI